MSIAKEEQIIHIFRHGDKYGISDDPDLSHWGVNQCLRVFQEYPHFDKPILVITSSLQRCYMSALLAFHPDFNSKLNSAIQASAPDSKLRAFKAGNIQFMIDPRVQEIRCVPRVRAEIPQSLRKYFTFPSEFFNPPPSLEEYKRDHPYCNDEHEVLDDFLKNDRTDEDQDWRKLRGMFDGVYGKPNSLERAASFKEFLSSRPEREVIIVSSNTWLESLIKGDDFQTCEGRRCVWRTTKSGRKKLVVSNVHSDEVLPDDDYSSYWKEFLWKFNERSKLFYKWYTKPYEAIINLLQSMDDSESERFARYFADGATVESLRAEREREWEWMKSSSDTLELDEPLQGNEEAICTSNIVE